LKDKGVEVYFQKENLYSFDSKCELLITMMSSIAQEESRNLSENITWGWKKRFADGKVAMSYGGFLGYEKGQDGLPKIVEREAETVRLIYKQFLDGMTPTKIASFLTKQSILTPTGKEKWTPTTVQSILQNEKYKGDALLHKTFTEDYLTKKVKINQGEVPQIYVQNSHPAIVSEDVFELVQQEFARRKGVYTSSAGCFAGRIICGECGGTYGSKLWHSNSKYRRVVWQCNSKFKNTDKCQTPHFNETQLQQAFIDAFNSFIRNKDEIISLNRAVLCNLIDTSTLDRRAAKLQAERDNIVAHLRSYIENSSNNTITDTDYAVEYKNLSEQISEIDRSLTAIEGERLECAARLRRIAEFLSTLEQRELLTEFDEDLWRATVETVTIHSEHEITFKFKNGTELHWEI